jgi:hypothetical protein
LNEEAKPIEPMTDNLWTVQSGRSDTQPKYLENTSLAHKKVMVLVDIKPGMTVMKSKYVFKIKKKFGKISRYKAIHEHN